MKPMLTDPPWADKILKQHWAAIERVVGAAWMPRTATAVKGVAKLREKITEIEDSVAKGMTNQYWLDQLADHKAELAKLEKKKPKGYEEYGCGHYGCVMSTGTPGLVFKITTDATEAAFIAAYLSWPKHTRPNGIVRYHRLLAIRSASHLKRPVFLLWRDEANHLGSDGISRWIRTEVKENSRQYYSESLRRTTKSLETCLTAARDIRKLVLKKPDAQERLQKAMDLRADAWELGARAAFGKPPMKLAFHLQKFEEAATEMENEPMGIEIGRALRECLTEHGLLLADVHLNNIGMVATKEVIDNVGNVPIITDPGHAIAIDDRYKGVTIEDLETATATNPRRKRR